MEFISYRGGGPVAMDLIARNTDALVITLPAITEQVRQGAIRPLTVPDQPSRKEGDPR